MRSSSRTRKGEKEGSRSIAEPHEQVGGMFCPSPVGRGWVQPRRNGARTLGVEVQKEIDDVPSMIEQDPAATRLLFFASPRGQPHCGTGSQGMKLAVEYLSDEALSDPVDRPGQDRSLFPVVYREGDSILPLRQTPDLLQFGAGSYEGLLAEYVNPVAKCLDHERGVGWRRRAHVDEIQGFPGVQLLGGCIGVDARQQLFGPFSPCGIRLAYGPKRDPALFEPAGEVSLFGHVAEPDHCPL